MLHNGCCLWDPLRQRRWGQVKTFNWTQDVVTDEQMRVSDSQTHYTDKGIKVSGALELWASASLAEETSVGGITLAVDDTP